LSGVLDDLPGSREFTWRDGERLIVFRDGALRGAAEILHDDGWDRFELLTTERALGGAPLELPERAAAVHQVPGGRVAEVAAELIESVTVPSLVALGGGRVIDVAKAITAVHGGRVAALPTTLSGAEMTRIHRLPEGHVARHLVRPALVVADPGHMTSLGDDALRASAMNSLAHGFESLYMPLANPVSSLAALRGAGAIADALDAPAERRDRTGLALGSLLSAYAMDSTGFALHHVVCQTLVAVLDLPHAEVNAAMLPHTIGAIRPRAPEAVAAFGAAIGAGPDGVAARVDELGGGRRSLSDLGADHSHVEAVVEATLAREQLARTPDPPGADELRELFERAW
jgi:alcohol dehydrogenase class IV